MESEEKEEKKGFNPAIILGVAVIAIVILFIVVISIKPKPPEPLTVEYNGYKFVKKDNLWFTDWQVGKQVFTLTFRFNPQEVRDVSISGHLDQRFFEAYSYITFDPVNKSMGYVALAASELSLNLARGLATTPIAACTFNASACSERPIITCNSTDEPVIYLNRDGPSEIVFAGNCITLSGDGIGLLKSVDKLLYLWYGIDKQGPAET